MKMHLLETAHKATLVGVAAIFAIFASATGLAQEIIMDNNSPGAGPLSGTWYTSSGPNPYLGHSVYNNNQSRFYWPVKLPVAGDYDVYAWWTYHPSRSNNVPYEIQAGSSPTGIKVHVDQHDSTLGGQWNMLGRFSFVDVMTVTVSSENGQASADAIRLVLAGSSGLPFEEIVVIDGYQHLGDSMPVWETTIEIREDQLRASTYAALEFVATGVWEGTSSNIIVNARKYVLPISEPLGLSDIALRGKTVISIPVGLLRPGDNTITIESGPINDPTNLFDDFYVSDLTLVLSR
jgi:hypothetical protein